MISHKHKFIFIHIPKNAGTSIESIFWSRGAQKIDGSDIHYDTIDEITAYNYFIFSIKRNPYCRIVSLWKYWTSVWIPLFAHNKVEIELNKYDWDFSSFCKNFPIFADVIEKYHKKERVHFLPQVSINDNPNYVKVDFWMRFENLQEDFNIVCDKIGIPQQKLSHKNKTNHKHYTEYYDDKTREIVAELYTKDIEYFGYKFGE
tara:strand:+ start:491 stop:1099 length:609 start_codon:yes stop_codon:yes gene_type:complete